MTPAGAARSPRLQSKVMSMSEAIERFVSDGVSVAMGLGLEALIPFAAGHEIVRQRRRRLTLIGPISDILFDQLIGAGCVARVIAAWVGNVSAGLGHNYRRAAEQGVPAPIVIEDHSNFTIALGLLAGALGAPYIPTRSLLGTDIAKASPALRPALSAIDGAPVLLVPALIPDVAIVHVQRSDERGACHAWGNLGVMGEAALSSTRVIVVAEQLVDRSIIESDPNRVLVPPHRVSAVVHEPGGAHPSPVQGAYGRDHEFYHDYHHASRSAEGFDAWRADWIDGVASRRAYLERLGADRFSRLRVEREHLAAPVNYSAT